MIVSLNSRINTEGRLIEMEQILIRLIILAAQHKYTSWKHLSNAYVINNFKHAVWQKYYIFNTHKYPRYLCSLFDFVADIIYFL